MIIPATIKKNVVVIGGGPAGLEAARVAAKKGHQVTLIEKQNRLGGQLNIADVPPRKREMHRAVQDLVQAVRTEGVSMRLGENATIPELLAMTPDAVIVAVEASSFTPTLPGVDGPNMVDAWKVLSGEQKVQGRVAVIGGGLVGCETAEYLAEQGCKVSLVEKEDTIADGISNTVLPTLLENYRTYGVEQFTGHQLNNITIDGLICKNKEGTEVRIPCDYVVMAIGSHPVNFDVTALTDKGIAVVKVGDCYEIADISHAIKTGYDAANAL